MCYKFILNWDVKTPTYNFSMVELSGYEPHFHFLQDTSTVPYDSFKSISIMRPNCSSFLPFHSSGSISSQSDEDLNWQLETSGVLERVPDSGSQVYCQGLCLQSATLGRANHSLCYFCFVLFCVFFYVTSVPIDKGHIRFRGIGLELACSGGSCWGISLTEREKCHLHLDKTLRIICNCKLVPGHYREY